MKNSNSLLWSNDQLCILVSGFIGHYCGEGEGGEFFLKQGPKQGLLAHSEQIVNYEVVKVLH